MAEGTGRLTWGDVFDADWPMVFVKGYAADLARKRGKRYMVWARDVYRVALEGVAGAIDPPERIGTVAEIMEGEQ